MSYRFVKICSYYTDFLLIYYRSNPNIHKESYQTQFRHLMEKGYGYSDYFSNHMNALGNVANEIIYNALPLQKAWAGERRLKLSGNQLIIKQLIEYKTEVVLFQDSTHFSKSFIRSLRDQVPTIKLIIGMCCSPITEEHFQIYSLFDVMLVCSPRFTEILEQHGLKSYLFYHSIERSLCENIKMPEPEQLKDVIFIGSFIGSDEFHDHRLNFIEELLKVGIDITIISKLLHESRMTQFLKTVTFQTARFLKKSGMEDLAFRLPLIKKFAILNESPGSLKFSETFISKTIHKSVFGREMLEGIAGSKIGLNIHGGVAGDYAANVRLFEVTGAGSCLLTDDKKNINELFKPDVEIVTYNNAEECIAKIRWLLEHPAERNEIARRGRERTLKDHTVFNRIRLLDEIISDHL